MGMSIERAQSIIQVARRNIAYFQEVNKQEKTEMSIEELDSRAGYSGYGMPTFSTDYIRKKKVNELVQQKINALKGDSND